MTQGSPVYPYIEDIVKSHRMLTRVMLRHELKIRNYPMGGIHSKITAPVRILHEDFGWASRRNGRKPAVYCAPGVSEEEYKEYCGKHCYGYGCFGYDPAPLEAFTRRIAFSYAIARMSPEWKESAHERQV